MKTYPLSLGMEFWHAAVSMFLRATNRKKDGKDHRYFSIVENRRVQWFVDSAMDELYVLAKSQGRQAKEIAIRRKRLARLLRKLHAMRKTYPSAISCCCVSAPRKRKRVARLGS